nr:probable LRR receptor-like serine/threonine-protein kinase At5g45780 isoform X2 [Ipomoea trifida]
MVKALKAGNAQLQKGTILDWVRSLYDKKRLEVIVDKDLKGCFNTEELEKTVDVALECTQPNPNHRPKMSQVSRILEGIAGQMAPPLWMIHRVEGATLPPLKQELLVFHEISVVLRNHHSSLRQ